MSHNIQYQPAFSVWQCWQSIRKKPASLAWKKSHSSILSFRQSPLVLRWCLWRGKKIKTHTDGQRDTETDTESECMCEKHCYTHWLLTRARLSDGLGVADGARAESGTWLDTGVSRVFTPRVKYDPRSTAGDDEQSPCLLADCAASMLRRASLGAFVIQPSLYTPMSTHAFSLSSNVTPHVSNSI